MGNEGKHLTVATVYLPVDNEAQRTQCLETLRPIICDPACSTSMVLGDFNSTNQDSDRLDLRTGRQSENPEQLDALLHEWGELREIYQPCFTYQQHPWASRIDRVYTNLHPIDSVLWDTEATIVRKHRHLSSHLPDGGPPRQAQAQEMHASSVDHTPSELV